MEKCKKIEAKTPDDLEIKINEFLKGLQGDWIIHNRIINHIIYTRDQYKNKDGQDFNDYFGIWVCFIFYE